MYTTVQPLNLYLYDTTFPDIDIRVHRTVSATCNAYSLVAQAYSSARQDHIECIPRVAYSALVCERAISGVFFSSWQGLKVAASSITNIRARTEIL